MIRFVMGIFLLSVQAVPQTAQAPVSATFQISGTVVDHLTNRPLGRVLVRLSPVSKPAEEVAVLTEADGRFYFGNLAKNKYRLTAERRGESPHQFGAGADGGYATAIAVGPGLAAENLIFPLSAGTGISGKVTDDEGEPVTDAMVTLLRQGILDGENQTIMQGGQQTNSSGEFHFGRLQAGTYLLAVQGRPWYASQSFGYRLMVQNQPSPPRSAQQAEMDRQIDVAYPVTYYGDTTDPERAAPIILTEGNTARVQVIVRSVPAVRARVATSTESQGGVGGNFSVRGPGGFPIQVNGMVMSTPEGLEIAGLPSGRYLAQIQTTQQGKQPEGMAKTIDITDGGTVSVQGTSKISVSGQVIVEGGQIPKNFQLFLSGPNYGIQAAVSPEGTFSFENEGGFGVAPGRYSLHTNQGSIVIKSFAIHGGRKIGDKIELLEGTSATLAVVASPQESLSKLDGTAVHDGKPISGAMVLLLPRDFTATGNTLLVRRDQSDSDGTFTLPGIPSGRYVVVAIDNGRDLAYKDPAVIKPYLAGGTAVILPLGSSAAISVNVQGRIK